MAKKEYKHESTHTSHKQQDSLKDVQDISHATSAVAMYENDCNNKTPCLQGLQPSARLFRLSIRGH